MMNSCSIPPELFDGVCSSIDKLDKYSWDIIGEEIIGKGVDIESVGKLKMIIENNKLDDDPSNLNDILQNTSNTVLDLSLARGLNYYTGTIFEVVLKDVKSPSIAGGGRYDDLCGIPCIGFSLGIDRILNYCSYRKPNNIKAWVIEINDNNNDKISLYRLKIDTKYDEIRRNN